MFSKDKLWKAKLTSSSGEGSGSSSSSKYADPETELASYLEALQGALQPPTRQAAQLPNPEDLAFHKTLDRPFGRDVDAESSRLLGLVERIQSWASEAMPKGAQKKGKGKEKITDKSLSAEEFTSSLGDLIDHLLERADTCLDEYTGKLAPRSAPRSDQTLTSAQTKTKSGKLPNQLINANINPLPQTKFTTKADNTANTPWTRVLRFGRPHSKPRDPDWETPPMKDAEGNIIPWGLRRGTYTVEDDPRKNPYHYEIMTSTAPDHALEPREPIRPADMDPNDPEGTAGVPLKWVRTEVEVRELLAHLKQEDVKEIAIDLEHHSYRTYQGIVCLMQISTRYCDYLVDTLSDEVRETSELLNEAFADSNKVKILHGANHDVLWLQRDLGLYLVNLFDTYHATHILGFPMHSLAYLLQRYCDFEPDKRYQLADWRIRPMPKEMLYYARSDTHSLIYIYDRLRAELRLKGGLDAIKEVFEKSKNVATKVYAKEEWNEDGDGNDGWKAMWSRMTMEGRKEKEERTMLGLKESREMRLVKVIHKWRDQVAREEDESPRYILSANNLMMVANRAPRTEGEALACFTPGVQALRKRSGEIAKIIEREVIAWEKERDEALKKREAQAQAKLEGTAMEIDEDAGEKVVTLLPVADRMLVNEGLWKSAAPQKTILPLLASSSAVFNQQVRPVSTVPAPAKPSGKRKAASLFAMPEGGNPYADVTPTNHAAKQHTLESIRKDFAYALTNVMRFGRDAAPSDVVADAEPTVQHQSMEPETVPFVRKEERKTISKSISGRYESLFVKSGATAAGASALSDAQVNTNGKTQQEKEKEEDPDTSADFLQLSNGAEVVQVAKKQNSKKAEKKRKRAEQKAQARAEADEASGKKRRKSDDGKPLETHDFSKEQDLLSEAFVKSQPAEEPFSLISRNASAAKAGTGERKSSGPAPRKRNEPSSGNRSSTFAS